MIMILCSLLVLAPHLCQNLTFAVGYHYEVGCKKESFPTGDRRIPCLNGFLHHLAMPTAFYPRDASLVMNSTCSSKSNDPVLYGSRKVHNLPDGGAASCLETARMTVLSNCSRRVGADALIWAELETGEKASCHLRYETYSFSEP
ncbi:unnamed protein product [Linum trigynum]